MATLKTLTYMRSKAYDNARYNDKRYSYQQATVTVEYDEDSDEDRYRARAMAKKEVAKALGEGPTACQLRQAKQLLETEGYGICEPDEEWVDV